MSCNEVAGRGTDAVASPDFVDERAGIGLLKNRHDLDLRELRLALRPSG